MSLTTKILIILALAIFFWLARKTIKKLQTRFEIFRELIAFLWDQKLWWIIPMIVILVFFAFLVIFGQGSGLAPFVYTLF